LAQPGGISLSPGFFFVRLANMFSRAFGLLVAFCVSASGAELVFNFGDSASDKIPEGFTNVLAGRGEPGVWKIVMDEMPSAFTALTDKAPSVSRRAVLAQTSMDLTDERFPMLVYTKETFDDFTLTTKFKLVEGVSEQMAGIAFRWQDEKNFYVVRASGLGRNLRFYSVVNGQRGKPIGPEVSVPKGVWHELKIECQGNKIRAWLNGNPVPWEGTAPELNDTSFRSGKIGFWTKSDSVSHFTDTRITYTPRESRAQALVRDTLVKYPRLVGLKVYLLDDKGEPRIAASKEAKDLGEAGGNPEKTAITSGTIFYGKSKETVSVVQPLRDRNGDPIAAVRLTMTSFLGQTEQSALQRALPIVKSMQAQVSSMDELR
jgi:hypothetical protein